jgi:hypothetical protein
MVDSMNPSAAVAIALSAKTGVGQRTGQAGASLDVPVQHGEGNDETPAELTHSHSNEWSLSRALTDLVSEGGYAVASDDIRGARLQNSVPAKAQ